MLVRSAVLSAVLLSPILAQNSCLLSTVGVDAFVEVPYDAALVPPSGMTIEAWITFDDSTMPTGSGYYPTIVRQNVSRGGESYLLRVNSGSTNSLTLLFLVRDRNGTVHSVTAPFQPGQLQSWTHLAATYGPGGLALFLNGQALAGTPAATAPMADNGGVLRIGNGDTTYPGYESWNGQIDELRIWPFARSAAEIRATMNEALSSVPGNVLTFNLDNSTDDSSAGLTGNAIGVPVFSPSSLSLATHAAPATSVGQSWSSCRGVGNTIGSRPTVGNATFRVVGTNGAPNGAGVLVAATSATAAPVQVLGIGVHVQGFLASAALPTDPFGTASVTLPIPPVASLAGVPLHTQWAFADAACGSAGLTASPALSFTIQ